MKTIILAILSAAAAVHATGDGSEHGLYKGPIGFPPGIEAPPALHLPHKAPPFSKPLPIWHPPHGDVFIDDCDDEDDEDWHWAWKKHGDKPHHGPPHKWITTTVTVTKTEGAEPTEEVTESLCPVPVTDEPALPARPTGEEEEPAPEPTAEAPAPEPTEPPVENEEPEEPAAEEPPVEDDSPVAPPADAPDADVSSVPQPPVEAGAGAKTAGMLAVVAGVVAALF